MVNFSLPLSHSQTVDLAAVLSAVFLFLVLVWRSLKKKRPIAWLLSFGSEGEDR